MLAWLYLGQGADLHMAQLMPLPLAISCWTVNPGWFCLSGAGIMDFSRGNIEFARDQTVLSDLT